MTRQTRRQQKPDGEATAVPWQTFEAALEAKVQERTAALQQEKAQLQAALQSHQQSEATLQQENVQLRAMLQAQQQNEATLRQQEEQFRTLVNNVPGAVYRTATDGDWTIAFVSDAIAKLTGYPATDFMQNQVQSFDKICHPDDVVRVNREVRAAIAAKQPFVLEYRNIRADGQVVWVSDQGHAVYDANDEELWLDGVFLDITALKQTEEALRRSEERLKLITDALPVCLSYVDRNQRLQVVNKTYETWFGQPQAEMLGKQLSEIIGAAAYQLVQDKVERALKGEAITYEMELPYQWGGSRYVRGMLVPDMDDQQQVHGYYALIMDTTEQQAMLRERKQAEEAAKQQAERERLLNAIAQRIRESLQLEEILNTTVQEVRLLLNADRALIYRFQPDQTGVISVESVGNPWQTLQGEVIRDTRLTIEAFKWQQQQGQTIIADIHDAGLEAFYVEILAQRQVRASMMLPITVGEQIWGLLMVQQCVAPRVWQPWEVDFLTQLATQLAIAIQQSELFQQVQQCNTVLEGQIQEHIDQLQQALAYEALLKRITDSVRDSLDETQIFQTAVRELAIGLQLNGCSSALYDVKRQNLTITHEHLCYDLPPRVGHQVPLASEPNLYSQVRQGECLQFCPLPEFSSSVQAIQAKYTILACPISIASESVAVAAKQEEHQLEIIGDLWLFRPRDGCFSEMEIRLVQQVSNQCAIAIRQSRLYQAARAQVVELERLNQLKDDFLSTVSHELRTPMSNIKMATQMLEVTLFSKPNDDMSASQTASASPPDSASWQKVSRYFQILKDEGEREIKLINNLLDLSKLDSGREPLFLSTMHLKVWLPYLAEPFVERTKAQQQTLLLSIAPDLPPLTTDFSYLERILSELLHNACKYTPSGETLTVLARTVTAVADQPGIYPIASNGTIELSVTNSGVEILPIECDRVFDKFYRIPHNDPWKHGGTGLGLALVKKLVERLEGSIWVESGNKQTSFVMRFPRSLG